MNEHISPPFEWDDTRKYQRGKVLSAQELEGIERFGRYLDVDNDGIPYRTLPGTHPTKGAFFTRGTSRDEYAAYTENGAAYKRNMDRLLKKWHTARSYVPAPTFYQEGRNSPFGLLFFGTTRYAAEEALDLLEAAQQRPDGMLLRAFPFHQKAIDFLEDHERIFVVEQNRDAQMKSLLMIELGISADRLISVLNYDGMPVTAQHIYRQIKDHLKI
jgi:2-oxoglutarate ferredoxin oxidoreductase subunit alpha